MLGHLSFVLTFKVLNWELKEYDIIAHGRLRVIYGHFVVESVPHPWQFLKLHFGDLSFVHICMPAVKVAKLLKKNLTFDSYRSKFNERSPKCKFLRYKFTYIYFRRLELTKTAYFVQISLIQL